MIANRSRRRVMLASAARTLHVGPLTDCFSDPATALCIKHATSTDSERPLTALCEPTRCPNACIAARYKPAWECATGDAKALLRERCMSELQRRSLTAEVERLAKVIDAIDPLPPVITPG